MSRVNVEKECKSSRVFAYHDLLALARNRGINTKNKNKRDICLRLNALDITSPDIPDAFVGPVSHQLMIDPVILNSGHSFERSTFNSLSQPGGGGFPCPLTRVLQPVGPAVPNLALRSAIIDWISSEGYFDEDNKKDIGANGSRFYDNRPQRVEVDAEDEGQRSLFIRSNDGSRVHLTNLPHDGTIHDVIDRLSYTADMVRFIFAGRHVLNLRDLPDDAVIHIMPRMGHEPIVLRQNDVDGDGTGRENNENNRSLFLRSTHGSSIHLTNLPHNATVEDVIGRMPYSEDMVRFIFAGRQVLNFENLPEDAVVHIMPRIGQLPFGRLRREYFDIDGRGRERELDEGRRGRSRSRSRERRR